MKVLLNNEIAKQFEEKTGMNVIPLPSYQKLDHPVSAHADMLFCVLDNKIFCYEDYIKESGIYDVLKHFDYDIVFISNVCRKEYPYDISLNVLIVGKIIFCNKKHTSIEILKYAEKNGYTIINVNQGYSACSTLVLNEDNIITSDPSIFKAATEIGKKVLLVDNSNIKLNGYNCGFIGGATGVIGNKIYFFGDYRKLSYSDKIEKIACSLGFEIITILPGGVFDFGGIKLL